MTDPVRAILVPEDGRHPVRDVRIAVLDGGLQAIGELVSGLPDEIPFPGRADVIAFICEDAKVEGQPRNNRATALLAPAMTPGDWIAGDMVLAGQQDDGGLCALPDEITAERVDAVGSLT